MHHGDHRRPQHDNKKCGKDKKDQREKQFDGGLRSRFLHRLYPLSSQRIAMNAQCLGNAGSKFLGLDQHGDKITHTIHIGTFGKMLPSLTSWAASALFQHYDIQFIA